MPQFLREDTLLELRGRVSGSRCAPPAAHLTLPQSQPRNSFTFVPLRHALMFTIALQPQQTALTLTGRQLLINSFGRAWQNPRHRFVD